ncbi:hypothetical protein CEXT_370871 [Caerostris extrusa]|uniref:Uncharacterized protein n=1 Tax=Caerostris extrusa TaxID=172846 RepID=A0AAV4XCZ5_CAEEX|nr:hypothetical protein CEXT_370871 [Caerostris extrusa]
MFVFGRTDQFGELPVIPLSRHGEGAGVPQLPAARAHAEGGLPVDAVLGDHRALQHGDRPSHGAQERR